MIILGYAIVAALWLAVLVIGFIVIRDGINEGDWRKRAGSSTVEQRPPKPPVTGSSPVLPANFIEAMDIVWGKRFEAGASHEPDTMSNFPTPEDVEEWLHDVRRAER